MTMNYLVTISRCHGVTYSRPPKNNIPSIILIFATILINKIHPMHHLFLSIQTAINAGKEILNIYSSDEFTVEKKDDQSPLTTADLKSNEVISRALKGTAIPVLSEESKILPYEERRHWKEFFLVDPLDGTKEFVNRNGEFTVNIALIREGQPVMGVIYAPVLNVLYFGSENTGSYKLEQAMQEVGRLGDLPGMKDPDSPVEEWFDQDFLSKLPLVPKEKQRNDPPLLRFVASKSHLSDETLEFIESYKSKGYQVEFMSRGSSLKLCLVAEGSADLYPRLGPTMEWDIAAGHAIAKYAGKKIRIYEKDKEPQYNKEDLLNPWFVVGEG